MIHSQVNHNIVLMDGALDEAMVNQTQYLQRKF
jgi:hypothetical protein